MDSEVLRCLCTIFPYLIVWGAQILKERICVIYAKAKTMDVCAQPLQNAWVLTKYNELKT